MTFDPYRTTASSGFTHVAACGQTDLGVDEGLNVYHS